MEEMTYIGDGEGAKNLPRVKVPETEGISVTHTGTGLQDSDRLDKV